MPARSFPAVLAVLLLLCACGGDNSGGGSGQPAGADSGNDGALLSVTQADLAARQWWSDNDGALVRRDAAALTRLEADPGVLVTVEELRVSVATGRPLLQQPRTPSAVRVHVPAQQSWPVPVLAVFDVPAGSSTAHIAVLLAERNRGAPLVALETASLNSVEPELDVDAGGYVRMVAPADQVAQLGRSGADLGSDYGKYMGALANSRPAPSPPLFADGKYTSVPAGQDAAFVNAAKAGQARSVGSAGIGYVDLSFPTPVFGLKGGGGLALFAEQRDETLLPTKGNNFLQDQTRGNFGVDLPPGQYPQIAIHSIVVVAVSIPPAGGAMVALGTGGGIYSEG